MSSFEVVVVGAGLSGLHTAFELHKAGIRFLLLEARDRLGGRILSVTDESAATPVAEAGFDLGPAWFWPGQPRMASLVEELGLSDSIVEQFGAGDAIFEDPAGGLHRGQFGASMAGSFRLRGGMAQLIDELAQRVPAESVRRSSRVESIEAAGDRLETTFRIATGLETVVSRQVVVAMPPRLAAQLRLTPEPITRFRHRQRSTPTWMAWQGKVVALYDLPFWRRAGLSGDVISHRGPLGEIHDISPGGRHRSGALFGFFAVAPDQRRHQRRLQSTCVEQLVRLFGDRAADPQRLWLKDWAADSLTATALDRDHPEPHSGVSVKLASDERWTDRVVWSGSEMANARERTNGYLEGALEASFGALERLKSSGVGRLSE